MIQNNVIQQGPNSPNYIIIEYGAEGNLNPGTSFVISGNTILNDRSGSALAVYNNTATTTAQLTNNKYFGLAASQIASGPNTQIGNQFLSTEPTLDTTSLWAATSVDRPPVVSVTNSNVSASPGQVFAATSLFTASDPDGDAITQYDFWDTGGGGGRFLVGGVVQPINTDVYVTAAQLAQTTYKSGTGADTLWVRANDGTQWSAWSPGFTVTG